MTLDLKPEIAAALEALASAKGLSVVAQFTSKVTYILPSSVYRNSFVCRS
jgi:hypothetical protein